MIGGNGDTVFARLCEAMGRPDLATDPRYATHVARGERQAELDSLIEQWTLKMTIDQLEALMIAHSVPAGRVYTGREMLSDPHFAEREAIANMPHPKHGHLRMQAPMPRLSETPSAIRRRAPSHPGEHNLEVYRERLGLDAAAIEALQAAGII